MEEKITDDKFFLVVVAFLKESTFFFFFFTVEVFSLFFFSTGESDVHFFFLFVFCFFSPFFSNRGVGLFFCFADWCFFPLFCFSRFFFPKRTMEISFIFYFLIYYISSSRYIYIYTYTLVVSCKKGWRYYCYSSTFVINSSILIIAGLMLVVFYHNGFPRKIHLRCASISVIIIRPPPFWVHPPPQ